MKEYQAAGQTKGIIFDIKSFAIHDGKGIRKTIFFKGCPMSCRWCHNPESQQIEPAPGIGKQVTVAYVIAEIEKDTVFYDESSGGVTFSGGEPLLQPDFLHALLDECRHRYIHTIVDTCGYASPALFETFIEKTGLFYYDLKLMDNQQHIEYTGVPNITVLENLEYLSRKRKQTVIRFPVIPGITDTEKNLKEVAEFVARLDNINEIHLLPYHRWAEQKYHRLGKEYSMKGTEPPTADRLAAIREFFESHSLVIKNE